MAEPGFYGPTARIGNRGPEVVDARTNTPETDGKTAQRAPEATRRRVPAASAPPEKSGRDLAAPLAIGAAAGAVAGIVNASAGALQGILAGAVAGIATALAFGAIRSRSLQRPGPEPTGVASTEAEYAGDEDPGTSVRQAAIGLVRNLPAPAILVDEGRVVLAVSRPAEDLLRRVAERRPLPDSIRHPELLSAVQQSIEDGIERKVTIRESVPQDRHLEALVAPLGQSGQTGSSSERETPNDPQGGPQGALILLRDLTAQIRADRMRVDLVANVSHELRTPLASLAGFLETLRGPAADDPVAQERFLRIMEEQTARMTRLVDTLMSLSNIEMDEHRPPTGRVELNATVRRVVDALKIVADRLGSWIVVMHDLEPAEIAGDEDQIAQVARNLIENAIKYGRPGTAIQVRVFGRSAGRPAGMSGGKGTFSATPAPDTQIPGADFGTGDGDSEVALSVSDSSDGIPEEHLPRLTERFYRVDVARARSATPTMAVSAGQRAEGGADQPPDSGGAGLGLAIVKHIVARHGGRLEISSELGVGSTFTAVFPPTDSAPPAAP